jgi:hypothetical protein
MNLTEEYYELDFHKTTIEPVLIQFKAADLSPEAIFQYQTTKF